MRRCSRAWTPTPDVPDVVLLPPRAVAHSLDGSNRYYCTSSALPTCTVEHESLYTCSVVFTRTVCSNSGRFSEWTHSPTSVKVMGAGSGDRYNTNTRPKL